MKKRTMTTNPIHTYKRLIVLIAFGVSIAWTLAGTDFLGEYTRIIIAGVSGAGMLVFLTFYKEEIAEPEQSTTKLSRPLHTAPPPQHDIDVSQVIAEARKQKYEQEDIFGGFK